MFGICSDGKMKIPVNGSLFSIEEVDGPIRRGDRCFPVRVCYASNQIQLLRSLPEQLKKHVLAAAISEAFQKQRIPLIFPPWQAD